MKGTKEDLKQHNGPKFLLQVYIIGIFFKERKSNVTICLTAMQEMEEGIIPA